LVWHSSFLLANGCSITQEPKSNSRAKLPFDNFGIRKRNEFAVKINYDSRTMVQGRFYLHRIG
jgi:hypothetical protein